MAKIFGSRFTLGKDPEIIETQNGTMIAKFSAAENHSRWNKENEEFEDIGTTWYQFVAFNDLALQIFTDLAKGDSFSLGVKYNKEKERYETDAFIRDDTWETDDGEKRSMKKVTLFNYTKLEKKKKDKK